MDGHPLILLKHGGPSRKKASLYGKVAQIYFALRGSFLLCAQQHLAHWAPVTRVAAPPTLRHGLFRRFVDGAAAFKNGVLLPIMSLLGCYELDAAVAVLRVVPSHKAQHPLACLIDRSKRLLRIPLCHNRCPLVFR